MYGLYIIIKTPERSTLESSLVSWVINTSLCDIRSRELLVMIINVYTAWCLCQILGKKIDKLNLNFNLF